MSAAQRQADTRPLEIDVVVESSLWEAQPQAERIVQDAIAAAAEAVSETSGELAVMLTDDEAIRILNRDWRGLDKPTNVLSFPAADTGTDDTTPVHLGDIAIAYETMAREAGEEDKPFAHHLSHLAIHGFLHLVGYDHEDDDEADAMETTEVTILARLGIPDPYRARDMAAGR